MFEILSLLFTLRARKRKSKSLDFFLRTTRRGLDTLRYIKSLCEPVLFGSNSTAVTDKRNESLTVWFGIASDSVLTTGSGVLEYLNKRVDGLFHCD